MRVPSVGITLNQAAPIGLSVSVRSLIVLSLETSSWRFSRGDVLELVSTKSMNPSDSGDGEMKIAANGK